MLEEGVESKARKLTKRPKRCTCHSLCEHNLLACFRRRAGYDARDHACLVQEEAERLAEEEAEQLEEEERAMKVKARKKARKRNEREEAHKEREVAEGSASSGAGGSPLKEVN